MSQVCCPRTAEPFAAEELYSSEIERPVIGTRHGERLLEQRDGVIVVSRGRRPRAKRDQGEPRRDRWQTCFFRCGDMGHGLVLAAGTYR
jgi:hypothetical protein